MNEQRHSSPWGALILMVGLALTSALLLAVWLIGAAALTTMGMILVVGIALALVIAATALPIRAWRRKDYTGESHHYHDGTRTVVREVRILDGRAPAQTDVKLLQLPAQPSPALYPELLSAAYRAGRISSTASTPAASNYDPRAAYTEAELPEVDMSDDGWAGDITGLRP